MPKDMVILGKDIVEHLHTKLGYWVPSRYSYCHTIASSNPNNHPVADTFKHIHCFELDIHSCKMK